jgi:hypothetical protein
VRPIEHEITDRDSSIRVERARASSNGMQSRSQQRRADEADFIGALIEQSRTVSLVARIENEHWCGRPPATHETHTAREVIERRTIQNDDVGVLRRTIR